MQGNILIKWIHENEGYEYYENERKNKDDENN